MTPPTVGARQVIRAAGLWFLVPLLVAMASAAVLGWTVLDHLALKRTYAAACRGAPAPRCCDVCGRPAVATVRVEGPVGRTFRRYVKEDRPACGQHRADNPWSVRSAAQDRESFVFYLGYVFPAAFFLVVSLIWIVGVLRQFRAIVRERIAAHDPWATPAGGQ
jgi:hypothetical protein